MTAAANITDPMERLIAAALEDAGLAYVPGEANPSNLDFRLTESGIEIEVKRFHSPRIAAQMERTDNVIVAQGKEAVEFLATLIRALRSVGSDASLRGPE